MFKIDNVQSQSERGRSAVVLSQSAYTERPIPPLVEEETPLPISDGEGETHRQRGDFISLLRKI
jgi:hypothetical protein